MNIRKFKVFRELGKGNDLIEMESDSDDENITKAKKPVFFFKKIQKM